MIGRLDGVYRRRVREFPILWAGANRLLIDRLGAVDYTYYDDGSRKTMADSTGTTSYSYDALGRLSGVTFPGSINPVSYTYFEAGDRKRITYPDGKTVDYTYYADHRMQTVTDWLSQQTAYHYDDAGRLSDTDLPNTVVTTYGYDNADRLNSVVNTKPGPATISSFAYNLDGVGNRKDMTDASSAKTTYHYDALYHLTGVDYPGGPSDSYTYDGDGNRLTKNSTTYTYNAADVLQSAGGTFYFSDNNGNPVIKGSQSFSYDFENRIQSTNFGYFPTYNGDGLRTSLKQNGQVTNYTWDVNSSLPSVIQDTNDTYVYGLDLISSTDGSGNQTFYTTDGLGSTTDLTNSSAAITDQYSYDVFGALRSHTGSSSNYWQFTGEQLDPSSSLQYLRARYYDPATGRFMTRDPISPSGPFAYSFSNPTTYVDPLGLSADAPGIGDPFGLCGISADCNGGGGGGGGGVVIITVVGGVVYIVGASGNVIWDSASGTGTLIADVIHDIGDLITNPFQSSARRTSELEVKYSNQLKRAANVILDIIKDPCNDYNRRHQEAKLRGFLANLNETGAKLGKDPVTYNPDFIPCLEPPLPIGAPPISPNGSHDKE